MGRELCFVPHPLMSKLLTLLKPHQVKLFFLLSALLGYARWIFTGHPKWFIFGLLLSGLLLSALYEGKPGLLRLLKDAVRFKSSLPNYLSVILPLLLANLATLLIAYIIFGDLPSLPMLRTEPLLVVPLAFLILTGGPLAEELFGLRGFALPRLLDKYTPLVSSLIVGFFFGAWHLIEFFNPGSSQYAIGLPYYPLFILSEIAHSILMTWVYLKSGRNLFLGGIFFHLIMNLFLVIFQTEYTFASAGSFPPMNIHYFVIYALLTIAFSIFIAIKTKMYQPQPTPITPPPAA